MIGAVATGFAIGVAHALEPDHLAAVGAMAANDDRPSRNVVKRGLAWGIGHAAALVILGICLLQSGVTPTEQVTAALECCLAVLIITLAVKALLRLKSVPASRPANENSLQIRLVSPKHGSTHQNYGHPTSQRVGGRYKTLMIGLLHGTAGSSAILILTMTITQSYWTGLVYIAAIGVGSIVGMIVLSQFLSLTFAFAEQRFQHLLGYVIKLVAWLAILAGVMLITSAIFGIM